MKSPKQRQEQYAFQQHMSDLRMGACQMRWKNLWAVMMVDPVMGSLARKIKELFFELFSNFFGKFLEKLLNRFINFQIFFS